MKSRHLTKFAGTSMAALATSERAISFSGVRGIFNRVLVVQCVGQVQPLGKAPKLLWRHPLD